MVRYCLTRHFLAHGGSPDTIVNAIASTQRKTQLLLNPLASLLHHFHFFKLPGSYVGYGNQLVGVWPKFFSAKIPPLKGLEAFTRNFAPSKIFHYVIVIHKYFVHVAIVGYEAKV